MKTLGAHTSLANSARHIPFQTSKNGSFFRSLTLSLLSSSYNLFFPHIQITSPLCFVALSLSFLTFKFQVFFGVAERKIVEFKDMGCVSSHLLSHDDDFTQLGTSGLGQHIVSLTSTTYGLLSLDPPQPQPQPQPQTPSPPTSAPPRRFTFGSIFSGPLSEPRSLRSEPEIINSWELMAGLDTESFRFSPIPCKVTQLTPPTKNPFTRSTIHGDKENSNPNSSVKPIGKSKTLEKPTSEGKQCCSIGDGFELRCPPNGENRVVVYTTSLRGVRKTFEDCSAVVAAIEGLGFWVCQRDISMDRGFREELREVMKGKDSAFTVPPRVFVKGRYVGGAQEVLKIAEEGALEDLLEGLPKIKAGAVCEGCGGARFLPCFGCDGSCKMVVVVKEKIGGKQRRSVVVRCPDCNENGLVLCPICS